MTSRNHFGTVRQRGTGRWQAVYYYEGKQESAGVFPTKADAHAALAIIEADRRRGVSVSPRAGRTTVEDYAKGWLKHRPDLAERTHELYEHVTKTHITPVLGRIELASLTPLRVREWHANLSRTHPATAAKAYRLLSTIMKTAVNDGLITTSPCRVRGAGVERSSERPVASFDEIERLEAALPEHLRIVVPLAVWCQLRRGEILGLQRQDIRLKDLTLNVRRSRTFSMSGESITKAPKSLAGVRSLAIPPEVARRLQEHLKRFVSAGEDSHVVSDGIGRPLSANSLHGHWRRARERSGAPGIRFHDLRHAGLTYAAATGATTVELMHRAGHASAAAAMRYQHALKDRDRLMASALDALIQRGRSEDIPDS